MQEQSCCTRARTALDAVEAAEHRTRRAARAEASGVGLILAAKAGASSKLLAKLLHAYAAGPEPTRVDVILCGPGEQKRPVRSGRADVAILARPYDAAEGLDVEEFGTEASPSSRLGIR